MAEFPGTVFVVEDDLSVREALSGLIRSAGWRTELFGSAQEFLDRGRSDGPGCLVLDVRLPGLSGLELQAQLAERRLDLPIIFVTGHADIPMSVRAMKAGALEFLTKPFDDRELLDAIDVAIRRSRAAWWERTELSTLRESMATLTPREREVMTLVIAGRLNKQIATALGITEVTVKVHRGRVMAKMRARSLADLVRKAERLGIRAHEEH